LSKQDTGLSLTGLSVLLQEVLLDADADMTAATLKTKLDASGPDARQDHAHNPLPPSQDKQPDLSAQSHVQTQQDASADTHSQLPARELESEQGNAEIVARMTVAQKMGTEGAFHDLHSEDGGRECQTGDKVQHSNNNMAVNSKQSCTMTLDSADDISCLEDIRIDNA